MDVNFAIMGIGLGAGLTVLGAALGIGKLAASSVESMARQPEVVKEVRGSMILTAALIEGVALFAMVTCYMMQDSLISFVTKSTGG